MGSPKLGPTQVLVLLALDAVLPWDAPPTPAEVADYIAKQMGEHATRRPTSEAEAANGALRRLERRGYVERLGKSSTGARCWAITGAGMTALRALAETEGGDHG